MKTADGGGRRSEQIKREREGRPSMRSDFVGAVPWSAKAQSAAACSHLIGCKTVLKAG